MIPIALAVSLAIEQDRPLFHQTPIHQAPRPQQQQRKRNRPEIWRRFSVVYPQHQPEAAMR